MTPPPAQADLYKIIRIINAISRVQDNMVDRFSQNRWGLTVGQIRTLLCIAPGESVRTLELARRLFTDPGTVSGLLRRLTQKGLLQTEQLPTDRRVQLVSLTPAGQRIRSEFRMTQEHPLPLPHHALQGLSPDDQALLLRLLVTYANRLMDEAEVQDLLRRVEQLHAT